MVESQAKILAVEGDFATASLLRELIEGLGHACVLASNGEEALEKIASEAPDLVLLDLVLPALDGLGVLQRLRGASETRELPVIIVSDASDLDGRIRGIELGADDYLAKPFKLFELSARVSAALSMKRFRSELHAAEAQLADAKGIDPVTGAGTYAELKLSLAYEVSRARRYARPLSALLIGVEAFDALRKKVGGEASDEVLRNICSTLRRQLRDVDHLFRLDADEFFALLPETEASGARICAERMGERVAELRLPAAAGATLRVTIGEATFPSEKLLTPEDLIRRAHEDLHAKRR